MLNVNHRGLRIRVAAIVFLALGSLALSQNRNALQQLYGTPVGDTYRTSKGLLIQASFAPNGNLCVAHINAENRNLEDAELETVLEELAPKEVRGEFVRGGSLDFTCLELNEAGEFNGRARNCGGSSSEYERATITKWGNTNDYNAVDITYYRRGCKTKRLRH